MRSTKLNGQQVLNQTMFPEGIALIFRKFSGAKPVRPEAEISAWGRTGLKVVLAFVNRIRNPGSAHLALPNTPVFFQHNPTYQFNLAKVFFIQHSPL